LGNFSVVEYSLKEIIVVTAKFDERGRISPVRFIWRDNHYRIDSTGRRWVDQEGTHILVMDPRRRVFHLLFEHQASLWYLVRGSVMPGRESA
jgi:hypothetical protein